MKKLVKFLAEQIVDEPKKVEVTDEEDADRRLIIHLAVAASDMGKIIGKGGKTIKAIRTLLKIKAVREGKKTYLELVNPPE